MILGPVLLQRIKTTLASLPVKRVIGTGLNDCLQGQGSDPYHKVVPQFCLKLPPLTFGFPFLAGHSVQYSIESCHFLKGSAEFKLLLVSLHYVKLKVTLRQALCMGIFF